MDDRAVVAAQLERPPRAPIDVRRRCHWGLPVVIAVPPLLEDGTPFPTRYWLTCPLAVRRIGTLESSGGVRAAEEWLEANPSVAERQDAAMGRYAAERDALVPAAHAGPRPSGGIGGTRRGVKCLHAQYADHAAGNDNPVGEATAAAIEPLDCARPCVIPTAAGAVRNPAWRVPRRDLEATPWP